MIKTLIKKYNDKNSKRELPSVQAKTRKG